MLSLWTEFYFVCHCQQCCALFDQFFDCKWWREPNMYPSLCVWPRSPGQPVVWAGSIHGQYGDLWLGSGRQAGQQQEHPETQILQTGIALPYHLNTTDLCLSTSLWKLYSISDLVLIYLRSAYIFYVFFLCLQHCTLDLGSYIKDLSVVHKDLSSIVILDNSPGAYRSHPGEVIHICVHTHTTQMYAYFVMRCLCTVEVGSLHTP